jgi:hypothetical protein
MAARSIDFAEGKIYLRKNAVNDLTLGLRCFTEGETLGGRLRRPPIH